MHRHRYYGVLAPNAPLRAAVTALAPASVPAPAAGTPDEAPHRAAARYLWAMLLARIDEACPLTGPFGRAEMCLIAFITAPSTVRQMLDHLGEPTRPPRRATIRPGTTIPRRHRRSNSISASRSEEQRLPLLGMLGRRCSERGTFGPGRRPVRLLRAGERQMRNLLGTARRKLDTAKTDIDHDQAVNDTRAWTIELPILSFGGNSSQSPAYKWSEQAFPESAGMPHGRERRSSRGARQPARSRIGTVRLNRMSAPPVTQRHADRWTSLP